MSGHSKWAQIKRQKGVADQKRGNLFSKLSHSISLAAREGGGNPETNFKLRLAIDQARAVNMPNENIERAIKKGTGEGQEAQIEDIIFEAYGPAGVAFIIQAVSSNKNRTLSEIRSVLSNYNGRLGGAGSVTWMFEQKGVVVIDPEGKSTDNISMQAIDAGAENIEVTDDGIEIHTNIKDLEKIKKDLEAKKLKILSAEISMIPKNPIEVASAEDKKKIDELIKSLEAKDDVVTVFTNLK